MALDETARSLMTIFMSDCPVVGSAVRASVNRRYTEAGRSRWHDGAVTNEKPLVCENCGTLVFYSWLTRQPVAEGELSASVRAFNEQIGQKQPDRPRIAYRCRLCAHQFEGPIPADISLPQADT